MRGGPHTGARIAECAAAGRRAHPRGDRERRGVDHHEGLPRGGAQPHLAATRVDVAVFQRLVHLDPARYRGGRRIDPGDGAVALFLHPYRSLARRQEAGLATERGRRDDGVGGGVDLLQALPCAADRPERPHAEGQIIAVGIGLDRRGDGVGGGIDARDHALGVACHPDRSGAGDDVEFALRIGDPGRDDGGDLRGLEVDPGEREVLAVRDP